MTPPSTPRNRINTQAELSVVLDAAACTTSADASPSAGPVAPVGPVGPVGPVTAPVTPVAPPVGPVAVSPSGPVVASGDGVSVGDGCSVGGGCSPSRSRMAMIARISRPCSGGRAFGRFGGRLGRWLRGLLGGGLDRTGRPGRCGRFAGLGRPGRCGRFPGLATGRAGRARAREHARQPADAARQRLPDLVSRFLGARGREQTQHHEEDHELAKTVAQDASFHPHVIDGVSALARPRRPPQPPRHPPQLPRP